MQVPLPLVGPDYADETELFGAESTINLIPEVSGTSGTQSRTILRTHGGLTAFVTGLSGAVRGMKEMGGELYVVAGESLYRVDSGAVATNLGTILGGGRCILADNFIPATKRQLVIMTGERGYLYDTLAGLSEITDDDFVSYTTFETAAFLDGYIVVETEDGLIYSAVTDASTWNALDFATAESSPDRVAGVWVVYGDLWVFGGRTIEVFRTTADEDVFQRVQTIEKGCGAKYSMANVDNGVFWIDETGRVYRANGFSPVRVSDHSVEQYLASVDFSQAFGFTYVDRGHEFYGFTVPNGKTFLYDVATGLWHRRKSYGIERWRISAQAQCYGFNLFGDYSTGTVWKLDTSTTREGSDFMPRERITGYLRSDTFNPLLQHSLDLLADTGNAEQTGELEETNPVIEMRYLDDGRTAWSNWRQVSLGAIGQYAKRLRWHQLGRTRQRAFHFRITDPVRCDLIALVANVTEGAQA